MDHFCWREDLRKESESEEGIIGKKWPCRGEKEEKAKCTYEKLNDTMKSKD